MSTLPTIQELAQLWPMILVASIFAIAWIISAKMERHNAQIWRMKRKYDLRHKAHMDASR